MARMTMACDVQDIRRAALSMIDNHGKSAAEIAWRRAQNLGSDSADSRRTWERIVSMIGEIESRRPQTKH